MADTKSEAEKGWIRLCGLPFNPYLREEAKLVRERLAIEPDRDWRNPKPLVFESLQEELKYWEDTIVDPGAFEVEIDQLMRNFKLPEAIRGDIGMYVWTDDTWWLEWGSLLARGIRKQVRQTAPAELEITFSGITPEHSKADIEILTKVIQKERGRLLATEDEEVRNRPMRRLSNHLEWYQQWLSLNRRGYTKIMDCWNSKHEESPIINASTISKAVKHLDECFKPEI